MEPKFQFKLNVPTKTKRLHDASRAVADTLKLSPELKGMITFVPLTESMAEIRIANLVVVTVYYARSGKESPAWYVQDVVVIPELRTAAKSIGHVGKKGGSTK